MLCSRIKQMLKNGERPVGMLMTFDFWPGYLELMKKHGIDFVMVDTEHGWPSGDRLEELCRLGRAMDFPVMVRPSWCDYIQIKKVLDVGAHGIMVPWVESEEQLDTLYRSVYCPPRGIHGMGGPSIMAVDGVGSRNWKELEDSLLITCQIETPKGAEMAEQIASREFLDLVMMGPYDLAHNMGLVDSYLCPEHIDVLVAIMNRCHSKNKPVGMVVGSGKQAKQFFELGYDLVIMGECTGMFQRGLSECMKELRE